MSNADSVSSGLPDCTHCIKKGLSSSHCSSVPAASSETVSHTYEGNEHCVGGWVGAHLCAYIAPTTTYLAQDAAACFCGHALEQLSLDRDLC